MDTAKTYQSIANIYYKNRHQDMSNNIILEHVVEHNTSNSTRTLQN